MTKPANNQPDDSQEEPVTQPETPDQTEIPRPNPFNVSAHRGRSLNDDDVTVEKRLISVPVRRPNKHEFVRTHPSEDYTADWYVLEHTPEGSLGAEIYWVPDDLWSPLSARGVELRPVRIFTTMSRRNVLFLWPAKLPGASEAGRRWANTALEVAETAKDKWVKMAGNSDLGGYELFEAKGVLPEPKWPDKTLDELIEIAFKDRLIDGTDHPVLMERDGWV